MPTDNSARKPRLTFLALGATLLCLVWATQLLGSFDPRVPDPVSGKDASRRALASQIAGARPEVSSPVSTTESLQRANAEASRQAIHIRVVDEAGVVSQGARILVTTEPVFHRLGSVDLGAELTELPPVYDAITLASQPSVVELPTDRAYYIRVEGANGVPGTGPPTIPSGADRPKEFTYVVGQMWAGAVVLSDGEVPVYVDWAVDSRLPVPRLAERDGQSALAKQLGLDPIQTVVVAPKNPVLDSQCRIAICHPKIGWFRASATIAPLPQFTSPTIIAVPATGERKPVLVTVRCVDKQGREKPTEVRLMGGESRPGSQTGFPRFGRTFLSSSPQLFPPGRLEVSFVDGSLTAVGTCRFDVFDDQTITVELPFTPRRQILRVQKDGIAYRGPLSAKVRIPALKAKYGTRWQGAFGGLFSLSVPTELECFIDLVADERRDEKRASIQLVPGNEPDSELLTVLK